MAFKRAHTGTNGFEGYLLADPDSAVTKFVRTCGEHFSDYALFNPFSTPTIKSTYNNFIIQDAVITHTPKLSRISVIGCGGTGSWLIPKLVKTINDMNRKGLLLDNFALVLVDGDTVEPKNLVRQNFVASDVGKNKAEVMAQRYGAHLDNTVQVIYYDRYITNRQNVLSGQDGGRFIHVENIMPVTIVGGGSDRTYNVNTIHYADPAVHLVFNLVDNDNARKSLHMQAQRMTIDNTNFDAVTVVDIGNEDTYGQLYVTEYFSNRCYRENFTENFFEWNSAAVTNEEEVKVYSCAEADVDIEKQDQFLVANDTAATIGHNWLCSYMMDTPIKPKLIRFKCVPTPTATVEKYIVRNDIYWYLNQILNVHNNYGFLDRFFGYKTTKLKSGWEINIPTFRNDEYETGFMLHLLNAVHGFKKMYLDAIKAKVDSDPLSRKNGGFENTSAFKYWEKFQ